MIIGEADELTFIRLDEEIARVVEHLQRERLARMELEKARAAQCDVRAGLPVREDQKRSHQETPSLTFDAANAAARSSL